jgi:outer membrane protein OmpA-like peptidoglycan-associated protein
MVDPFSPINSMLAPDNYVLDEGLYRSVDSMTIPQQSTHSSYLRVPVERDFIYGDLMVFMPSFESRVATWELVVSNSLGETVRRVSRKGQPPAVMTWDGKTDAGDAITVGEVYGFVFNAYDAQGNQTRIPGTPQRINAISYPFENEWVVAVAADNIFKDGSASLTDKAAARLDEAANIVKEKYKKEVVVYIYSEQEKLSTDRCRVIQEEVARRTVLPQGALKVAPRFILGLQPKFSKVEFRIN